MVTQNRHRVSLHSVGRYWGLVAIALTTVTSFSFAQRLAHAQADFSDTDIANYVRAVAEIEEVRLAAYESASDVLAAADSEADIIDTTLSCGATRMSDMPEMSRSERVALRTILVDFCNEASEIADSHALTASVFNQITQAHREDEELSSRIQAEIAVLDSEE